MTYLEALFGLIGDLTWGWSVIPTLVILGVLQDYRAQVSAGIERPVFNPDDFPDLDIDRTAWTARAPAKG